MERFKSLNRYQKGIMLFMTVMILVFAVIYAVVISREGFSYQNTILIPNQENGNTVYSGRIEGEPASFTVYADRTVVFRYGDQIYGPYTAREDAAAIPKDTELGEFMTGVLACVATVVLMLFADELFRWNLAFQIRNADQAEPSDWEIAGRYITWTLLPIAALILFITGLQ